MEQVDAGGVRSLARGLALLEALNRAPHATVAELARNAGMPRSTAYRLLNTLAELGYVARIAEAGFGLTTRVRALSDGLIDETWLNPAWDELVQLGNQLVWPLTLLTFDAASMVNRLTTHELSTMSIDYGMAGRRFPVTESASGRCYLAFCPATERAEILALPPTHIGGSENRLEQEALAKRLEDVRSRGYETRIGGVVTRTASIAVPVIVHDRVLCCLAIVFIASAMSMERAIAQFELPLKQGAARIAERVKPLIPAQ